MRENVKKILVLKKMNTIRCASNRDPNKMKGTEIFHCKFTAKSFGNVSKKRWCGGGKNNIASIKKNICNISAIMKDEKISIRFGLKKPNSFSKCGKALEPSRVACLRPYKDFRRQKT
jgi:hypothetical protein